MTLTRRKVIKKVAVDPSPESAGKPVRKFVPVENKRPGWPKLHPDVVDTRYEVVGIRVHAFVTDCNGLQVGWDICACGRHFTSCKCREITPPHWVVLIYRNKHKIAMPTGTNGYVGFRHDRGGKPAPMIIDSPVRRMEEQDDGSALEVPVKRPVVPAKKIIRKVATTTPDAGPLKLVRRKK